MAEDTEVEQLIRMVNLWDRLDSGHREQLLFFAEGFVDWDGRYRSP